MSSRKKGVHFGSRSKVREFNNVSGAVINLENVATKQNTKNYTRHERKKRLMEAQQFVMNNKNLERRQVMVGKSELQEIINLAGSAYSLVCDALDRCFIRFRAKSGTRRRNTNSRRSRTRKA